MDIPEKVHSTAELRQVMNRIVMELHTAVAQINVLRGTTERGVADNLRERGASDAEIWATTTAIDTALRQLAETLGDASKVPSVVTTATHEAAAVARKAHLRFSTSV